MSLRPGKKCESCKGAGCTTCMNRGFIVKKRVSPRKRIRAASQKRAEQNKHYGSLRLIFLTSHTRCQCIKHTGLCVQRSTQVHHRKGRSGELLTNVRTFMAVCMDCHNLIETKREWARRMGYLVNRLTENELPPLSKIFLPYESPAES